MIQMSSVLAVAAAVALALAGMAHADPGEPQLTDLASFYPLVSSPDVPAIAFKSGNRTLVVLNESGRSKRFRVSKQCLPAAIALDAVAVNCRAQTSSRVNAKLIDQRTGRIRRIGYRPVEGFTVVLSLGSRWALVLATRIGQSQRPLLVSRDGPRSIDLQRDPIGLGEVIDLDAAKGTRPLCDGLERTQPDRILSPYWPITLLGGWLFEAGVRVARCSDGLAPELPDGYDTFNARYVANAPIRHGGQHTPTTLIDLATGEQESFFADEARKDYRAGSKVALSRNALWITRKFRKLYRVQLTR